MFRRGVSKIIFDIFEIILYNVIIGNCFFKEK